jgi:hypothetical protein
MEEQIREAREYFGEHLSHMHINQVEDSVIAELLGRDYIKELRFPRRMDCLYDYLLSQSLCDVTE